jgi:hypothetical protein
LENVYLPFLVFGPAESLDNRLVVENDFLGPIFYQLLARTRRILNSRFCSKILEEFALAFLKVLGKNWKNKEFFGRTFNTFFMGISIILGRQE